MGKNLNSNSGLTFIEILIGSVLLAGTVVLGLGLASGITKGLQKDRKLFQFYREHKTLREVIRGIPADVVRATECNPHPYQSHNGTNCVSRPGLPVPTPTQIAAIEALSDVLYAWPTKSKVNIEGIIDPALDEDFYNEQVRPAILSAGCINCHDGRNDASFGTLVNQRDFRVFSDITTRTESSAAVVREPIATRAMFASPIGKLTLKPQLQLENLFFRSLTTSHRVTFLTNVQTVTQSTEEFARSTPATLTPQSCFPACNPDEFIDATRCFPRSNCPGCSGKGCTPPPCTYWVDYVCLKAEDDPPITTVKFILTSTNRDTNTDKVRRLASEGILH